MLSTRSFSLRIFSKGIEAAVVLLVIAAISFVTVRYVGDPLEALLKPGSSIEDYNQLRDELGLDAPITTQFLTFVGKIATGDFGVSLQQRRPIATIIFERAPATLELAALSLVLAFSFGIALGIYASSYPAGWIANGLMALSTISISLPTFLVAILGVWLFSIELRWLPAFGRGEIVQFGWWTSGLFSATGIKSLILPTLVLGLYQAAWIARLVRDVMVHALHQPFITVAKARGLPQWRILFLHALPTIIGPVWTLSGLQFGHTIAFAIVTERVFQWPGLGSLIVDAIQYADVPVIAIYLVLVGALFIVVGTLVDLAIFINDPRLRDLDRIRTGS